MVHDLYWFIYINNIASYLYKEKLNGKGFEEGFMKISAHCSGKHTFNLFEQLKPKVE